MMADWSQSVHRMLWNDQLGIFALLISFTFFLHGCASLAFPATADELDFWHVGDTWLYSRSLSDASLFHTLRLTSDSGGKYILGLNGSGEFTDGEDYLKIDGVGEALFDRGTLAEERATAQVSTIFRHMTNTTYHNMTSQTVFSPGLRYLDLPFYKGKTWNATVHADIVATPSYPSYPVNSSDLRYEFYVEGEMTVNVSAGNFTAMSVLVRVNYTASPNNGSDAYRFYYSDAVRNIVRFEGVAGHEGEGLQPYHQMIFFGGSGGELKDTSIDLHSYSLTTTSDKLSTSLIDAAYIVFIAAVAAVLVVTALFLKRRRSKKPEV